MIIVTTPCGIQQAEHVADRWTQHLAVVEQQLAKAEAELAEASVAESILLDARMNEVKVNGGQADITMTASTNPKTGLTISAE